MLEDVIHDRAVEAKFLNRLTFINLSALYVATQSELPNVPQFLETILAQYTLLLRLLSTELQSTQSTDIQAHITAIVRRTASSLRLYSKWLVLHHSQIPSPTFWHQYAQTATSLQNLWQSQSLPRLSYPLEEDLAAAGFAPFEISPNTSNDLRKRKHKRDRARIGNRKKGFDKLLLQWGRRGGDSLVTSTRNQGAEHPNVEMTLRLADLLSDAIEIASIPVRSAEKLADVGYYY
jgi:Est1 DNA/RNA binding domain